MGRTVNILDDINERVTTVEFKDSDGDCYQVTQTTLGNALKLQRLDNDEDVLNYVLFLRNDIDKLIALFQAAKHYNI